MCVCLVWASPTVADSALYSGKASRYIDITYEPVLRFVQEPATPESTSYAWIAGIIIPLVVMVRRSVVCRVGAHDVC